MSSRQWAAIRTRSGATNVPLHWKVVAMNGAVAMSITVPPDMAGARAAPTSAARAATAARKRERMARTYGPPSIPQSGRAPEI